MRLWQWLGKLPRDIHPETGWELHAHADGKDRRFVITSANQRGHWNITLQDVT